MVEKRNIGVYLILSIITCGIFAIYWFIVITDDVKKLSEDDDMTSGGVAFLLTLITCGIYSIYWAYKMGKNIAIAEEKKGATVTDNSILYLILAIFGFGVIDYCLIQNDLNTLAEKSA